MKKSKLLIPALSVASIGAIVAPMVTSCASEKGVVTHNTVVAGEAKAYDPTLKALDEVKYKDQKALARAYNSAINSNPLVFSQDWMDEFTQQLLLPGSTLPTSQTVKISNPVVTNTILYGDKLTSVISFNLDVTEEVDNYNYHLVYKLTNIPYTIYFSGESEHDYVAVVSTLKHINDSEAAVLAFIASNFAIDVTLTVTDKDTSTVYSNVNVVVDDVTVLGFLAEEGSTTIKNILFPINFDIGTHYFENAVQGEN